MDPENDIEYRLKRLEIYVKNLMLFSNIPIPFLEDMQNELSQIEKDFNFRIQEHNATLE